MKEKNVPEESGKIAEEKKEGLKFYPDIERNKKERRKTLFMSALLVVLMGGMGLTIIVGWKNSDGGYTSLIMGALMIFMLVFALSTIPNGFKQFPVKNEPIIEVKPREIKINGESFKAADIIEARLTIVLDPVGKKEENEKFVDSLLAVEPQRELTANVDVAVRDKKGKSKTVYTTVKNAYEALLALYKAGVKRYSIVYSLKKIAKRATFNLGDSLNEDGTKLSQISKKDRLKQLY